MRKSLYGSQFWHNMSQASILRSLPQDHIFIAHEMVEVPVKSPECFECSVAKPEDKDRFLPVMRKIDRTIKNYIRIYLNDKKKEGNGNKPTNVVSEWFKGSFLFAENGKQILVDAFSPFNLPGSEAKLLRCRERLAVEAARLDFN